MVEVPMQRAVRSEELPLPAASSHDAGQLRQRATAGSVVLPEYRDVQVDGRPVLLTRLASGEVVAFDGHCPHQGTSLRRSTIYGGLVRCEQHKFVYDPFTGRNVLPSRDASAKALERLKPGYLPTYPVEERDGWVWVGRRPNPPPDEDAPLPALVPELEGTARPAGADEPPDEPVDVPPQTVELRPGERRELDLPTRVRPNHLWRVAVDGDAVEVLGQRFEDRGDGAHYHVSVVARAAGTAEIHCAYAKPWDVTAHETRVFVVRVAA